MIAAKIFLSLLLFCKIHGILCYLDATLTNGKPIEYNDDKCVNFDKLRIKRVNKTEFVVLGSFQTFVELSNDYEVKLRKIFVGSLIDFHDFRWKCYFIKRLEMTTRKLLFMSDQKSSATIFNSKH